MMFSEDLRYSFFPKYDPGVNLVGIIRHPRRMTFTSEIELLISHVILILCVIFCPRHVSAYRPMTIRVREGCGCRGHIRGAGWFCPRQIRAGLFGRVSA